MRSARRSSAPRTAAACDRAPLHMSRDTSAAQIIRLAATLPSGAQERLERLRGFGAGFGRALTCACSRIVLADGEGAVLVAAAEPAGPPLTLGERVRRLIRRLRSEAVAAFAPDGTLIHANRGGTDTACRRDHAVGARHRDARRHGARNRQRRRTRRIWVTYRSRSPRRGSAKMLRACSLLDVAAAAERSRRAQQDRAARHDTRHADCAAAASAARGSSSPRRLPHPPVPAAEPASCRRA